MRFTKEALEEYAALRSSSDYADKLRAVAIEKEWEGDTEISEKFKTLAAQLDFADPNDDDNDAIAQTRSELAQMIDVRSRYATYQYHNYMSDQDILDASSGEVDSPEDYDPYMLTFNRGGLHDPNIFGGDGQIPMVANTSEIIEQHAKENGSEDRIVGPIVLPNPYKDFEGSGLSIGHIMLPMYCINRIDKGSICRVLEMDSRLFDDIMSGRAWYDTVDKAFYPFSDIEDHFYAPNILGYGDVFHHLLSGLNLPDHPERFAFQVLPVLCASARPCFLDDDTLELNACAIDDQYRSVILRVNRIKKLISLNAPPIIMTNELRILQERVDLLMDSRTLPVPDGDQYLSLYDMLNAARKSRVRSWIQTALLGALRMRPINYEIPVLTAKDIDPQPRKEFLDAATLSGDNSSASIPVVTVLSSLRDKMNSILEEMDEIQRQTNEAEDESDEQKQFMQKYDELHELYKSYGTRVDRVQQLAVHGMHIVVAEDEDTYNVLN